MQGPVLHSSGSFHYAVGERQTVDMFRSDQFCRGEQSRGSPCAWVRQRDVGVVREGLTGVTPVHRLWVQGRPDLRNSKETGMRGGGWGETWSQGTRVAVDL